MLPKSPWSAKEDRVLFDVVSLYGAKNWSYVAQFLPSRSGKQCRERWHNHVDPDVKKGQWANEEDHMIIWGVKSQGAKWAKIARTLPGRTDNAIKNRYNGHLKKLIDDGKIDVDAIKGPIALPSVGSSDAEDTCDSDTAKPETTGTPPNKAELTCPATSSISSQGSTTPPPELRLASPVRKCSKSRRSDPEPKFPSDDDAIETLACMAGKLYEQPQQEQPQQEHAQQEQPCVQSPPAPLAPRAHPKHSRVLPSIDNLLNSTTALSYPLSLPSTHKRLFSEASGSPVTETHQSKRRSMVVMGIPQSAAPATIYEHDVLPLPTRVPHPLDIFPLRGPVAPLHSAYSTNFTS